MGRKGLVFILLLVGFIAKSQQLPVFTQFKSNHFLFNPALTGTKRNIDFRINYRNQWTGFDDAPVTECISLNSRILDGKAGIGGFIYKDITGPTQRMNYSLNGSYHLRFSDVEFSFGLAGNMTQNTINGTKLFIHNSNDPAIERSVNKIWTKDVGAGAYLYNDRFSFGVSALNLLKTTFELYPKNSSKKGYISNRSHWYLTLGYNYSQNVAYLWEHTILINYLPGIPVMVDYTLRMHYKKKYFVGTSLRMGDAVAIHTGIVFKEIFQISYSYDIIVSSLSKTNYGSNEVMIVYSMNTGRVKNSASDFQRRKYQYLF